MLASGGTGTNWGSPGSAMGDFHSLNTSKFLITWLIKWFGVFQHFMSLPCWIGCTEDDQDFVTKLKRWTRYWHCRSLEKTKYSPTWTSTELILPYPSTSQHHSHSSPLCHINKHHFPCTQNINYVITYLENYLYTILFRMYCCSVKFDSQFVQLHLQLERLCVKTLYCKVCWTV